MSLLAGVEDDSRLAVPDLDPANEPMPDPQRAVDAAWQQLGENLVERRAHQVTDLSLWMRRRRMVGVEDAARPRSSW